MKGDKYMKNRAFKKTQRFINRCVRALNKNIYDDELWKGRFVIRQINRKDFSDISLLQFFFEMKDKETGKTQEISLAAWTSYECSHPFFMSNIAQAMNDFIIEDCKVWSEEPRPSLDTAKDYRKV